MSVKITQLEAENVKRIKAIQLSPSESGLTIIGGRNNQGKTSALDVIAWGLGGDRYRPSQSHRDGSVLPPRIRLELSNGIVVERAGKNSDLKVTAETGRRAGQQLLNTFVESFALDLPKFMESTSREKAATLLRVIGLEDQVEALEKRMEEALSRITGVGEVRVVLTLQSSPRRILAQDTQSTVEADSTDAALTTVVLSGGGTEETVTLQQISPQYQGALVVCSGGGNPSVRLQVVEAVSALTGLGADHISVCEGK